MDHRGSIDIATEPWREPTTDPNASQIVFRVHCALLRVSSMEDATESQEASKDVVHATRVCEWSVFRPSLGLGGTTD